MHKTWFACALSFCLSLAVVTAWVLVTPPAASAAYGEADCGYGYIVTCHALRCTCIDGEGCLAEYGGNGLLDTWTACFRSYTPPPPPPPIITE